MHPGKDRNSISAAEFSNFPYFIITKEQIKLSKTDEKKDEKLNIPHNKWGTQKSWI